MTNDNIIIRAMEKGEADAVAAILQYYASRAVLLWRTPEDILAHQENFLVALDKEEVVGCIALQDYGNDLYELRSLAVKHDRISKGLGRKLVEGLIQECHKRKAKRLFALTKKVAFFDKLNFSLVAKEEFPQKVWNDCILCHKKHACDEEAVVLNFN